MKLNFSRLMSDTHTSVEEETINRWRRAAMKPTTLAEDTILDEAEDSVWLEKISQQEEKIPKPEKIINDRPILNLRSPISRTNAAVKCEVAEFVPARETIPMSKPNWNAEVTPRSIAQNTSQLAVQEKSWNSVLPLRSRDSAEHVESVEKLSAGNPKFSIEEDMKQRFGARLRAALGAGTVIHGKLTFDTPVRIDGKLTGEVISSSTLVVGDAGNVKAEVKVNSLVVYGKVMGPVQAKDLVEIKNGGRLEGDIITQRLVIDEGGYFDGDCVIQILN